jgi:hypothetical protein
MMSEYVKFTKQEVEFGKKMFLQSQLETLDILKKNRNFLRFRNEEFLLKINLKNKLNETLSNILLIERLLPKIKNQSKKALGSELILNESDLSLEQEIDVIKRKLEKLNQNF